MRLFNYILNLSLKSCFVILAAMAVRRLIKGYSKKWSYLLWMPVFFGLVIQIGVPVREGKPSDIPGTVIEEKYEKFQNELSELSAMFTQNDKIGDAPSQSNELIASKHNKLTSLLKCVTENACWVWLGVIIFLMNKEMRNAFKLIGITRYSRHYRENIYYNSQAGTPFTFGFFKPKIYIPENTPSHLVEYIIAHEKAHIQRCDHIAKPLFLAISAIHWFNPLVWLAFSLMEKDMELSCDETAVKAYDLQGKKGYCSALLESAFKNQGKMPVTALYWESNCSRRIKNVLSFKKNGKKATAFLVARLLTVSVSALCRKERQSANKAVDDNILSSYADEDSQIQNDIEKEEATALTTSDKFIWPTQGYSVSRFYRNSDHNGIDIRGSIGDDIYACADGVVTKAEYTTVRNGIYLIIQHDNGINTMYSHCSELLVKEGDTVKQGQTIALVGNTGNSTGPHLHLAVFDRQENFLDPLDYIDDSRIERIEHN